MKTIYVYTDGSASNNKTKIGGWAYMILGLHKESGSELNTTSNRMELTAVINALKFLDGHGYNIKIYTDSAYIFNCFNEKWYEKWEKNFWKNSQNKEVLNKDLWQELLRLYRKNTVEFYKTRGHADDELNNEVDEMAVAARYRREKEELL